MKNKRNYSLWSLILVLFLAFVLSGCGTKQASEAPSGEKAAEKPAVEKAAFPTKEIVQLVPFTAGAGFDVQARKVGDELNKILGATIITENLPGAGSTLGLIKLQKEKPDGYMINHIHSESNPIQQVIFNAPYDMRDFTYLGGIRTITYFLVVAKNSPIQKIEDFKAKDRITLGTPGTGQPVEIAALTLAKALGKEIAPIPYDGNGPSIAGLLAGEVDFIFCSDAVLAQNKDMVRAITVMSEERYKAFPDVPTIRELGFADVFLPVTIQGIVGPKGMDEAVVKVLVDGIKQAMEAEGLKKWAQETGSDITYTSPEELKKRTLEMLDSAEKYRNIFEKK